MSSFLERYARGEYAQVWDDLVALGAAVREEPLSADALGVARETMRLARHNIELLVPRLRSLGFAFGDERVLERPPPHIQRRRDAAETWRGWVLEAQRAYCMFCPALPDARERIAELEQQTGILPLSLRAWYEIVGTVDFVGKPPLGWAREALGYAPADAQAEQELDNRFAAAAGSQGLTEVEHHRLLREHAALWHAANDWDIYLDPLCVLPVEAALIEYVHYGDGTVSIPVAPAAVYKWFQGYDDPYSIYVPSPVADAEVINEWHGTTFVAYLRTAFHWGDSPDWPVPLIRRMQTPPT